MKALPAGTCVAIFHSLHRVMAAEHRLRLARLRHRLVPTPRPLTSTCGLAIVFPAAEREPVEAALGSEVAIVELWESAQSGYRLLRGPTVEAGPDPEPSGSNASEERAR